MKIMYPDDVKLSDENLQSARILRSWLATLAGILLSEPKVLHDETRRTGTPTACLAPNSTVPMM